jgi:hypothetical protein
VRLPHHSNYFSKGLVFTAPWGAALCPVHQSALLGQGLLWRSLGRSLLANFNACAAQLLLQPGGGGCSSSVLTGMLLQEKNKVFKGSSAMPLLLPKYRFGRGIAAPLGNKA